MANLFEPSSILYFLILPIILGMGIDTRYKHRYPIAMSFGLIFFLFCGIWNNYVQVSTLSDIEPIIILIVLGSSILMISMIFEWVGDKSLFRRNALVFLTISVAGLPLYMIKYIMEGKMGVGYPESLLPILQFTLALIGLVVVANVFVTRIYRRNEGKIECQLRLEEDELDLDYEAMDELDVEQELYNSEMINAKVRIKELEDTELDYYLDELYNR